MVFFSFFLEEKNTGKNGFWLLGSVERPSGNRISHYPISYSPGFGRSGGARVGRKSSEIFFLPDRHTDFIFAIIGEELGFVGTSLVVVLFAIILWRGWKIAQEAQDEFLGLLAMGITISIMLQVFINMGAVLKLIPVTGGNSAFGELW